MPTSDVWRLRTQVCTTKSFSIPSHVNDSWADKEFLEKPFLSVLWSHYSIIFWHFLILTSLNTILEVWKVLLFYWKFKDVMRFYLLLFWLGHSKPFWYPISGFNFIFNSGNFSFNYALGCLSWDVCFIFSFRSIY
jgi:hypothetical protein